MTYAASVPHLLTTAYFALVGVLPLRRQFFRFLERSSALNQINDQNNHSNHEEQVDQAAPDMPKKAQKPENDKNYEDSPKHKFIFGLVFPRRIVCSNPTERLKAKS